jgi:cell division protein FtsB
MFGGSGRMGRRADVIAYLVQWTKRLLAAVVVPAAFLAAAGFFLWSASQGDRGLHANGLARQELVVARDRLSTAESEVLIWERRVANLRANRLDPDALSERARATLNLADPNDIILLYGSGRRLY